MMELYILAAIAAAAIGAFAYVKILEARIARKDKEIEQARLRLQSLVVEKKVAVKATELMQTAVVNAGKDVEALEAKIKRKDFSALDRSD